MILAAVLTTLLALAFPQENPAERIAAWHESIEMDLAHEVAEEGAALVRKEGPLARNGEAIALVARALFASGRESEAEALLEGADPSPETASHVELERARQHLERDRLEEAMRILRAPKGSEAPVRFAELPEAWILLARTFARGGRQTEAAKLAERFLALAPLHPDGPTAWHIRAEAALQSGDGASGERFLAQERELRTWLDVLKIRRLQARRAPDEPLPRFGIALCWMQVREFARAIPELRACIDLDPSFCRAYGPLADALRETGDVDGALETYERAVACDPDDHRSRFNRALLLLQRGARTAAAEDFEYLVRTDASSEPHILPAFLHLARIRLAEGDETRANELHARYRELGGTEGLEE